MVAIPANQPIPILHRPMQLRHVQRPPPACCRRRAGESRRCFASDKSVLRHLAQYGLIEGLAGTVRGARPRNAPTSRAGQHCPW
jgi:hypothetical protein